MAPAMAARAFALLFPALLLGPAPGADDTLRRVEERALLTRVLDARFVQSYRSELLGREIRERGRMRMKRPGRMRWDYEGPEKKLFLSDGQSFFFYVPEDRQVIVRDQADARGVAALLLAGRGGLTEQFAASLEPASEGRARLRLTPKKPDPELQVLVVECDSAFRIRALEVTDAQGNRSRFEFDALRENVGLPDSLFRFEPPKGVEVVRG